MPEPPPSRTVLKDLGRRIKALRRGRGITQEAMAGAAGISRTHATVLEAGRKAPSFGTLLQIAKALSVSPAELLLDPNETPVSSRAVIVRIYTRLLKSKRSVNELLRLEKLIDTFLRS